MSQTVLSLETLEIIDAIDRRGSFARAAEELDKVPSALSYSVQKLEERLDTSLFVRQGRRSVLTPAGKLLLQQGRKLLAASHNLEQEVKRTASGWETRIRIAIETIQDSAILMQAIHLFLLEYPNIEIEISEEVMGGTWEALMRDQVDLVIGATYPAPQSQGIGTESFNQIERVMAVAAHHPLAKLSGEISASELAEHRQVIVHDSSDLEVPRSSEMFSGHLRMYVENMAQKVEAQRQGIGYGFLPLCAIRDDIARGTMKIIKLDYQTSDYQSLIAWKIANRGKGLKRLREILLSTQQATHA